jgi:hypothetical protein
MHVIRPERPGDLGGQILVTDRNLDIHLPVNDRPGRWERRETAEG